MASIAPLFASMSNVARNFPNNLTSVEVVARCMLSPISDKTFFLQVFGCQMNEHDSERIAGMLESLGAIQVPELEESEIVVFVTCCVREAADTRLMGQVASMKNVPLPQGSKLDKRIVCIGGCIGQRDGAKLMESFRMSTWCSARRISIACRASLNRCLSAKAIRPKYMRRAKNSPPTAEQTRAYVGRMVAYYLGLQ